MNEITHIHLGRQSFTVSVDAHKALQAYLNAIKHQVGAKSVEVVKEVETRMAELLTERGIKGEKVVLPEDIDYLKAQLGAPQDFKEDDEKDTDEKVEKTENDQGPKRLYRDTDRGMIAGVASGLAAYLGIDAIFVRLLFIILAFAGGWGILAYIILWLLVPEAKTTSDILLMQGKAVTVDTLKKVVERADVPAAAHRASTAVGSIIERCMKVVLWVIGIAFTAAASISLLAIVSTSIYVAIRGRAVFQEEIFPVSGNEMLFTAMSLLASAILCLLLLLIGIAMVRRKWQLPGWAVASLVGIFFVSVAVGSAMLPDIIPKVRDRYRAAHHTSVQQVASFSEIKVTGDENTSISYLPDSKYFVELRYLGNVDTKALKPSVADQVLTVDARDLAKEARCKTICLFSDREVEVVIHAPSLKKVTIDGNTSFATRTPFVQSDIVIEASKEASIRLSHTYPTAMIFSNDSFNPNVVLALTGLHQGALDNDVVTTYGGNVYANRTDELRLQTDQTCDNWNPFASLDTSPQRLFVNGQAQQAGDLTRLKDKKKKNTYNCLYITDIAAAEAGKPINYYQR